ncbi:MAG TPA: hypothetical protein VHG08_11350 [Longimicrobium sp.]|nr:hypothetical protein [Longimicrobium sp.]
MRTVRPLTALAAAAVLLLGGCERGAVGNEPSWFRASLAGDVQDSFEGTGDFAPLRDELGTPRYFRLFSESTNPNRRDAIWIRWPSGRYPAPGRYALVPHDMQYGSRSGVSAIYGRGSGDNVTQVARNETYIVQDGFVEITRADRDVYEGTVEFTALQVYSSEGLTVHRNDSRITPDPTAPRIHVTGSFHATFFDESAQVGIPN